MHKAIANECHGQANGPERSKFVAIIAGQKSRASSIDLESINVCWAKRLVWLHPAISPHTIGLLEANASYRIATIIAGECKRKTHGAISAA